jgi:hypothetical protein
LPVCCKKKSRATWSRELFGKVLKDLSHFEEEESYEIAKINKLKDLGRFLAFFF